MTNDLKKPQELWSFWTGPKKAWVSLCLDSLIFHNPDIRVLDLEEFLDIAPDLELKDKFLCLAPNQQSDIIRAYLLSRHGGVWVDADCIALQSFDMFRALANEFPFAYPERQNRPRLLCTALIGCPAGDPIFSDYYSRMMIKLNNTHRYFGVFGPVVLRNAVKRGGSIKKLNVDDVMPIHFGNKRKFFEVASDLIHSENFIDSAYCYMLTHNTGKYYGMLTKDQILTHRSFLGFLLRKSFGLPLLT